MGFHTLLELSIVFDQNRGFSKKFERWDFFCVRFASIKQRLGNMGAGGTFKLTLNWTATYILGS